MFKYTSNTLKNLEGIFTENKYSVRYERGNFNTGYCILHDKKVIVVNKFFSTEGKINSLLEVIDELTIKDEMLSEKTKAFYKTIKKTSIKK